jgi:hypothetical protein
VSVENNNNFFFAMLTRGNRASGQKTQEEITLLKPTKSAIMKKENHD